MEGCVVQFNGKRLSYRAITSKFVSWFYHLQHMQPFVAVVQLLSCVWLVSTLLTAARLVSLSFISWSLFKLTSIKSVMPSNHLILCCPLLNLSQHQGLFQWISSLHQVAKALELQLQHQSFQWKFSIDFLWDWLIGFPCSPRDSQVFSNTTIQKHQFFSAQLSLCSNAWSIHDYKKNHSLIVWTFAGK